MNTELPLGPSLREGRAGVRRESRPAAGADLTSSLTVRPPEGKAAGPVAHAGTGGTLTFLDARTVEELQPPCEATVCLGTLLPTGAIVPVSSRPCVEAAALALHVRCLACGTTGHVLVCDLHDADGALATHADNGCDGLLHVLARSGLR